MSAIGEFAFKISFDVALAVCAFILQPKFIARWAMTGFLFQVEIELTGWDDLSDTLFYVLMALAVFVFLMFVSWVPRTELVVWDIGIDFIVFEITIILFIGKTRVSGDYDFICINIIADAYALIARLNLC